MEPFAGAVLALIAIALVINLIKGGPGQVREWIASKLLGAPA